MKKLNLVCLGLIFVLSVVIIAACGSNNLENETTEQKKGKVDAAMNTVNFDTHISDNIVLPTASGDVAISWSSDKPNILSNTGTVVRPLFSENDQEVKLTGSFSYKDYSDTKVYTLTVNAIKEKVITFAAGHTGDNAIFSDAEITDKGEGVISIKAEEENAPYINLASHIPAFKNNGFSAEILLYLDHEQMEDIGTAFALDFSLNKAEEARLGSVYLTFDADENDIIIYHSHTTDAQTDNYKAESGWYRVGVSFSEKSGKLHAKVYIKDIMGAELKAFEINEFVGFDITDSTGEHEPILISFVTAPHRITISNLNLAALDIKEVKLSYNL